MWTPRVSLIGLLVVALACGSSKPTTLSSTWVAPSILAQVPADSPYVFATLQPVDEKLRRRMFGAANQGVGELLKAAARLEGSDRASLEPFVRAGLVVADALRGKDPNNWWRELGFDPSGRFAFYGLSVWPVMRVEVADPARLRDLVERAIAAASVQATRATLDGRAYWTTATSDLTVIASVLDREAVVALVPTSALATALPLVLGTQKPARPLTATTTMTDLIARNRFLNVVLGYIDLRSAVAILTGATPSPLDAPLRALAGPIAPACRAELDRLVSVMPRMAFGYRRLDETGFEGRAVFETAPGVTAALKRLRTSVPEVTVPVAGHPLFAIGAAVKPDELISWLRQVTGDLRAHPFTCPWFVDINRAAGELADKLATPLPPTVRAVRGFSLVVDKLTISPFDVEGHVLIAGDQVPDLLSMVTGSIPMLPNIPVKPDGRPVEIPTQQLQIPVRSVHVAMTPDRIVIAAGPASAQRATDHLRTPAPPRSPLGLMMFDASRLQALLAALGSQDVSSNFAYFGDIGMSFDAADDGLGFEFWGTWMDPPPAASIAK